MIIVNVGKTPAGGPLVGITVSELLAQHGISIDSPCNGRGTCGKCRVIVSGDLEPPTESELRNLTKCELDAGVRLACQAVIRGECIVHDYAKLESGGAAILTWGESASLVRDPASAKVYVELPKPEMDDQRYYVDRLTDHLCAVLERPPGSLSVKTDRKLLSQMSRALVEGNFKVTASVFRDQVVAVEPGDTSASAFGMAFDIGTTTVVGYLVDLKTGREVAVGSRTNPQAAHGADLISRITYSSESATHRETLRTEILGAIDAIIAEVCDGSATPRRSIQHVVIAGNTCMTHMLLGLDTSSLATSPYVGVIGSSFEASATEIGIDICEAGMVTILPNIGGFVGSDTIAAVLASNIEAYEGASLLLDLGTNGELVLAVDGRMASCSTAAGPAFEGAHIRCGMRAVRGAITSVSISDAGVDVQTVGGAEPRGVCGSGLVQAVSELLRVGLIDETGRLLGRDELGTSFSGSLKDRIKEDDGARFVLHHSVSGEVAIYQRDVRELQLAKAAIAAGVRILCSHLGIMPDRLDRIMLAGAFGNYIDKESALRIGLVPDIGADRIKSLGNAAGTGAKIALLSKYALSDAERLRRRIEYVELGNSERFQDEFVGAMMFSRR